MLVGAILDEIETFYCERGQNRSRARCSRARIKKNTFTFHAIERWLLKNLF